jgi:hypothetical protein
MGELKDRFDETEAEARVWLLVVLGERYRLKRPGWDENNTSEARQAVVRKELDQTKGKNSRDPVTRRILRDVVALYDRERGFDALVARAKEALER